MILIDGGDARIVDDERAFPIKSWTFALERFELRIEDMNMTTALDKLVERTGVELAVNGGFFDPHGRPVGFAMTDGAELSPLMRNLSGGVLTVDAERARLFPTETFALPEGTKFGVECRPRLVVGGIPNVKSDDGKRSERSAICIRDAGKTIEILVVRDQDDGGPTLYALGRFLAAHGCDDALNLDGGPSTGVAWRENGKVQILPPRGSLRHAIVVRARAI